MDVVVLKEKIDLLSKLIIDLKNIAEDQTLVVLSKPRKFHFATRGPNKVLSLLFEKYNNKVFSGDSFLISKKLDITPDTLIKNLRILSKHELINLKEEYKECSLGRLTFEGNITEIGVRYILENNLCTD